MSRVRKVVSQVARPRTLHHASGRAGQSVVRGIAHFEQPALSRRCRRGAPSIVTGTSQRQRHQSGRKAADRSSFWARAGLAAAVVGTAALSASVEADEGKSVHAGTNSPPLRADAGAALLAKSIALEESAEPPTPAGFLIGSSTEQTLVDGRQFPLILCPAENITTSEQFLALIQQHEPYLLEQLHRYGAIMFRGFDVPDAVAFDGVVKSFNLVELPYVGGAAPRTIVHGAVFTTNESPPDKYIPFHHEMAQAKRYPHKLFFYCEKPPASGGQTSIIPSWKVVQLAAQNYPEFVQKLLDHGVIYTRVMPTENDNTSPQGRSWKSTYLTEDRAVAEEKVIAGGGIPSWKENGDLSVTSQVTPAIRFEKNTKRFVWFNSLFAAHPQYGWVDARNDPSKACVYGNGEPLERSAVTGLLDIMYQHRTPLTWEQGDVMMIDNRTVMHSRETFRMPRRVLASLWQDKE